MFELSPKALKKRLGNISGRIVTIYTTEFLRLLKIFKKSWKPEETLEEDHQLKQVLKPQNI